MRFHVAWAKTAQENSLLKTGFLFLGLICGLETIGLIQMALKKPLVIERGCFSRDVALASAKHTDLEIRAFVENAIDERFNSSNPSTEFLSAGERDVRSKEQKELEAKKLTQKVIVNSVKVDGAGAVVDADRLISVGDIRSAFRFPLTVRVESVQRTSSNPYGLVLSEVKLIPQKDK